MEETAQAPDFGQSLVLSQIVAPKHPKEVSQNSYTCYVTAMRVTSEHASTGPAIQTAQPLKACAMRPANCFSSKLVRR
eukprot:4715406-Pleurochrysis_carterae.AAC.1